MHKKSFKLYIYIYIYIYIIYIYIYIIKFRIQENLYKVISKDTIEMKKGELY